MSTTNDRSRFIAQHEPLPILVHTLIDPFTRIPHPASRIPHSLLALRARFSIAAVFWRSGQTKVQGFAIDLINDEVRLGWPRLSDSVVDLFRDEYHLPLLPPEIAAMNTAVGCLEGYVQSHECH